MKIHISSTASAMRVPLHATSSQGAADMEPRRQDYDRLDLTRQRKFRTIGRGKSESEGTKSNRSSRAKRAGL